ncbi:MAG: COX15/CtaA family protein [Betaproteobacteria bacterium]|nr:COX15/CtaA family protein [Betaproteobacteria bacterium]
MLYRNLAPAAAVLAFLVVVLGAYVRLSNAGLGCPDWPGCFGHITVPEGAQARAAALQAFPARPVDARIAWKEMIHRYFAGSLGLLILAVGVMAWKRRHRARAQAWLALLLVGLVVLQATLGMWTVTRLLTPLVVSAHLLGGMAILALLVWLALGAQGLRPVATAKMRRLKPWARGALALVYAQIGLGAWVSTNYADFGCTGFPTCNGAWWPAMNFHQAFDFFHPLGLRPDGQPLTQAALAAIQWTHRLGAGLTLVYVGALCLAAMRLEGVRALAAAVASCLVAQVLLGIATVVWDHPWPVALAHNALAALLLSSVVALNFRLGAPTRRVPAPVSHPPEEIACPIP